MAFVDFNFNIDIKDKAKGVFKVFGYFFLAVSIIYNEEIRDKFFNLDFFSKSIYKQNEIRGELNKLVKIYDCDYVSINLFHNGQKSINNVHFSKMSREYEGKKPTLLPLTYQFKNYDLNPYLDALLILQDSSYFYIKNSEKIEDLYMKSRMKGSGIKSVLYVAIWYKRTFFANAEIIGFMSYEFSYPTNFTAAQIEGMRKQVDNKIKYLVSE